MREIKFRAWDKEDKKIRRVDSINWFDEDCYLDEEPSGLNFYRKIENIEIMQYTGLHDKNGKEIYEGDIIGVPNPDCKYVVMFGVVRVPDNEWYSDNTVAGFYLREISNGRYHHMDLEDYHEIIGNIYEGLYSVVQ
jgi:uncharacterized phage protein (TIGR01671 family)